MAGAWPGDRLALFRHGDAEGLTGLDLAEQLKGEKPGLKVIISSGYSAEMAEHGVPAARGIMYLQKPYQVEVLAKTVRDCLDRA